MNDAAPIIRTAFEAFEPVPRERTRLAEWHRHYSDTQLFIVLFRELKHFDRMIEMVFSRARKTMDDLWSVTEQANVPLALLDQHGDASFAGVYAEAICLELSRLGGPEQRVQLLDRRLHQMLAHANATITQGLALDDALAAYGENDVENLGAGTLLAVGVVVVALVIVLALRSRGELKRRSAEFQAVSRYAGEPWATKLLRVGNIETWSLAQAWSKASLNEDEVRAAVSSLDGARNYRGIRPSEGDRVDARHMRTVGEARSAAIWVMELVDPGLSVGGDVVERAVVRADSGDALALKRMSEHPLTRDYLELHRRSSEHVLLVPGTLRDLAVKEPERPRLDEWLSQLVEKAPGNALESIHPPVGARFVEREMESVNAVMISAEAVVSEVTGLGLRRREGEVLLHAVVRTQGRAKR